MSFIFINNLSILLHHRQHNICRNRKNREDKDQRVVDVLKGKLDGREEIKHHLPVLGNYLLNCPVQLFFDFLRQENFQERLIGNIPLVRKQLKMFNK